MRRRLGVAGARRLRGELVRALSDKPIRGPGERIRLAELTLDSDVAPAVDLLVAAADDAIALTDVTLGERLARAAFDRGGGLAACELLARSLMWQGKATDADDASAGSTRTRWMRSSWSGGPPCALSIFKR